MILRSWIMVKELVESYFSLGEMIMLNVYGEDDEWYQVNFFK